MTIEREADLEIAIAVCDECGERQPLDVDPDDAEAITAELVNCGWQQGKPDKARFATGLGLRYTETYARDLCGDCQDAAPGPKPVMRAGHRPVAVVRDAFANDPIDQWPAHLVFAALGLNRLCGHPSVGVECSYCQQGYGVGRTTGRLR